MDLPKKETSFDFQYESETGEKYEGLFTVLSVLDMRNKHLLELEKTRLIGDHVNPTNELAGIAILLANLRVRIIDGPEWWKQSDGGYNITDSTVLTKLYDQVMKAEIDWRAKLKERATKVQEKKTT